MQQQFSKDNFQMKLSVKKDSHNDSIFETGSNNKQKNKIDSISRSRLISQSTLGDNSSKLPMPTKPSSNNIVAQNGSRTTDDLLQISIIASDINNHPSFETQQHASNHKLGSGRYNSIASMRIQDQSIRNSIPKNNQRKGLLGDYKHSQVSLPQVRDSIQQATMQSHFKKNDPYQRNSTGVELTKKELKQFQSNGVVSREFIHQNKKDLEEFIANQTKIRQEGLNIDRSAGEQSGISYFPQADGSHLNKEVALTEQQKFIEGLDPRSFVFSEDVRPNRDFKGETSQISSKVVENWINQTLSDAENLDIPSVILKPENKVPITRYGIDRNLLTQSGLSSEQVDRIYKGLFVYSVGFFENLKKQLQTCNSSQILGIQTNLWKTFNVLLEYCCKTDYRLLISRINKQNEDDRVQLIEKYQNLIQLELDEKKILKQNMFVMQTYQEQLEKDRNNERVLRLRLEEEYMQIQRNHEEEVSLRLKFEAKLNALNTAHRELEIKYDRVQQQYKDAVRQQERLDTYCKVQSEELVALRVRETDQLSQLEILRDYKSAALIEIAKKNILIKQAEEARKIAKDESDIIKYQVQDQDNQTRRLEMRIQDLTVGKMSLENHIKTLESQIQDQQEKTATKQEQLEKQRITYEELALENTHVNEEFQIKKVTSDAHIKIINQLREQLEQSQHLFEDHQMHSIVYKAARDDLRRELEGTKKELTMTSEALRQMNKERHRFEDLCGDSIKKIEQNENKIDQQADKIQSLELDLKRQIEKNVQMYDVQVKMEEQTSKQMKEKIAMEGKFNMKSNQLLDAISRSKAEREEITKETEQKQQKIVKQDEQLQIKEQLLEKSDLKVYELEKTLQDLDEQKNRYSLQAKQAIESNQQKNKILSESIRKQLALEESVRYLTQQKEEIQTRYEQEYNQLQSKLTCQLENYQMSAEETASRMMPVMLKLEQMDHALLTAQKAENMFIEFQEQAEMLQITNEKLQDTYRVIEDLQSQLEDQDSDFDSIIQRIMDIENERFTQAQFSSETKIAQITEMLKASKIQYAEAKSSLKKAERMTELSSKNGSQANISTGKQQSIANTTKYQKSGVKTKQKDNQERERVKHEVVAEYQTDDLNNNTVQSKNRQRKNSQENQHSTPPGSQETISKNQSSSKESLAKAKGSGFNQVIQDQKQKKSQQQKVNDLIMGRQKNQLKDSSESFEPNIAVIQKNNFKPLVPDQARQHKVYVNENDYPEEGAQEQQVSDDQSDQDKINDFDDEAIDIQDKENTYQLVQDSYEAQVQEEQPQQRDLQAEKFQEYTEYVLDESLQFLEAFKTYQIQIIQGAIKEGTQKQQEELKKIMNVNQKLPEKFLNLVMTAEQKEFITDELQSQKLNFQIDNEDILPIDDDESDSQQEEEPQSLPGQEIRKAMFAGKPVEIGLKDKSKIKKVKFSNLFSQIAQKQATILEKLVQEHAARVEKAAIERRKVKLVNGKVEGQVKGKKKTHYLIQMRRDPNYYEVHRTAYLEAIKKAEQDLANKQQVLEIAEMQKQKKADEIAKILLERHQRKVANIEIVREYLNVPELLVQPKNIKEKQIQTEPSQVTIINQSDSIGEPDLDTSKRQLANSPLETETEPVTEFKHVSPVRQILDAVISMSNNQQSVDPDLMKYIKGGVAGLNKQFNRSNSKTAVAGKQSSIRTLIRSVNSRL